MRKMFTKLLNTGLKFLHLLAATILQAVKVQTIHWNPSGNVAWEPIKKQSITDKFIMRGWKPLS
jgi:hypothetical protein